MFQDLSFSLKSGQALQVKGRNGAGKSSLIRILSGLLQSDKGEMSWKNTKIASNNSSYLSELLFIGHKAGVNLQLTAQQNLAWYLQLSFENEHHVKNATPILEEAYKTWKLYGFDDVSANSLSAGQQRRIALCRLLIEKKSIWLLDEPLVSLDTLGIETFTQLANKHLETGGCLIFSSHQALDFGDRLQILDLDAYQDSASQGDTC